MNSPLLTDFCRIYQNLNHDNLEQLQDVYSENIEFVDAIETIKGIDALTLYFEHLYLNMKYCHFHIEQLIEQDNHACIVWRMEYAHNKINRGKMIQVDGSSFLRFSEKIDYHRDFVDMGQMLYEQLPIVGSVIKGVKSRVRG